MDADHGPAAGNVSLERVGEHFQLRVNGIPVMSTDDAESGRVVARKALAQLRGPGPLRVAIGGLGIGYTLAAALADPRVAEAVVVELEPQVVEWGRSLLAECNGHALADPRTRVVTADVVQWVQAGSDPFHAIVLDVDNGPGWTVHFSNRWLYSHEGLGVLKSRLVPGGVLAVWGSYPDSGRLLERMTAVFGSVHLEEALPKVGVYLTQLAESGR